VETVNFTGYRLIRRTLDTDYWSITSHGYIDPYFHVLDIGFSDHYLVTDYKIINRFLYSLKELYGFVNVFTCNKVKGFLI
jgi:hypothetical protein